MASDGPLDGAELSVVAPPFVDRRLGEREEFVGSFRVGAGEHRVARLAQREVAQWEQEHRNILYDQHGRETAIGQKIIAYAKELGGWQVGRQGLDRALKVVYGEVAAQQAQRPNPQQAKQEKDNQFLRNSAQQKRNRDGTFARPETTRKPNPSLDIEDRMKKAFAGAGYDESTVFN